MKKILTVCLVAVICLCFVSCDTSLSPTLDDLLLGAGKAPVLVSSAIKTESIDKDPVISHDAADDIKTEYVDVSENVSESKEDIAPQEEDADAEIKTEDTAVNEAAQEKEAVYKSMASNTCGSSFNITASQLSRNENAKIAAAYINEDATAEQKTTVTPTGQSGEAKADEAAAYEKEEEARFEMTSEDGTKTYVKGTEFFAEKTNEDESVSVLKTRLADDTAFIKEAVCDDDGNIWFISQDEQAGSKVGVVQKGFLSGKGGVLYYELTPDEKCINDIEASKRGTCVLSDKGFYVFEIKDGSIVCKQEHTVDAQEGTKITTGRDLCVVAAEELFVFDLRTGIKAASKELGFSDGSFSQPVLYAGDDEKASIIIAGSGIARIDIESSAGRYALKEVWKREDAVTAGAPVLSLANSHLYAYTFKDGTYGFEAISFDTGETAFFCGVSSLESYALTGELFTKGNAVFAKTKMGDISLQDSIAYIEESPVYSFEAGSIDIFTMSDEEFLKASGRPYRCVSPVFSAEIKQEESVSVSFVLDGFGIAKKDCKLFYKTPDGGYAFLPSWTIKHFYGPYLLKDSVIEKDEKYVLTVTAKDGSATDCISDDGIAGISIVAAAQE